MHCTEARQQLEQADRAAVRSELEAHLQDCEDCRDYARERHLVELLASLPVREPAPGLEDRVLQQALGRSRPSAAGVHVRWALATAASVVLAVVVTLQFQFVGGERTSGGSVRTAVVEVLPRETRMIRVRLDSLRALKDARITVQLEENLALEGYEGIHHLQWRTTLKDGTNQLSLPVRLLEGQSGQVTVIVEHGNARKHFSIQINAASAKGGRKLSQV